MYVQVSLRNTRDNIQSFSERDLLNFLNKPPLDITVEQYIIHIADVRAALINKYTHTVNQNYIFALLLNFVSYPTRRYILNNNITDYETACKIAKIIENHQLQLLEVL
jgi:hypothetical protein